MATPATNTIGEVINGTAPDALVWGNGAVLDMNQPVNNMDRSLIMGVDATVSSGNIIICNII